MKYRITLGGFAYIEADSREEAEQKYYDGDEIYKEEGITDIEEVDSFDVYID